ncbi:LysR substrate-binding domain-containing protein [Priestia sp. OVS21]|nr:LysR substrate-binding domain-containing protein [Priestia sp. OVS21]
MSSVTESRAGIQWEYLWKDELYAYVPDTHSFASKQVLSISELAHESFIALKKDMEAEQFLISCLKRPRLFQILRLKEKNF